jgi:arginyl-tRNA--protein-N-Asp/Glu arginylyltransferase
MIDCQPPNFAEMEEVRKLTLFGATTRKIYKLEYDEDKTQLYMQYDMVLHNFFIDAMMPSENTDRVEEVLRGQTSKLMYLCEYS